jgi:hypothetical protein
MSGDFHGWEEALVRLFLRQLRLYRPGQPLANVVDKRLGFNTSCYFSSNGSCTVKPPVGGTWKATLDPPDASTGSLTLTMG